MNEKMGIPFLCSWIGWEIFFFPFFMTKVTGFLDPLGVTSDYYAFVRSIGVVMYYSSDHIIVACKVGWGSNLHPPMRVGVMEHVPSWPVWAWGQKNQGENK